MRKENKTDNTIKITEDVRVPGTDMILEKGDRIEVLKESVLSEDAFYEVVDWGKVSDIGEILSLYIGTFVEILEYKGVISSIEPEEARETLIQYLSNFRGLSGYINPEWFRGNDY